MPTWPSWPSSPPVRPNCGFSSNWILHYFRQYYTLVEQKAILLIFISIIDRNINFRLKWNWRKGQFELIKMSIDSSLYSCILCLYLEVEKISVDHNLNWQIGQFEMIKISIDSTLYSCIICLYLEIEKNINWSQSQPH